MNIFSFRSVLKAAALIAFLLASPAMAQETVVFKRPPPKLEVCTYTAKALQAKITELQNINAQLANRAKSLEVQVAALKTMNVVKHKKVQVCKRWNHHRCTWLVWK